MQSERKVDPSLYRYQTIFLALSAAILGTFLFISADRWRADLNQIRHKGAVVQGIVKGMDIRPSKSVWEVDYEFEAVGRSGKSERFIGTSRVRPETAAFLKVGMPVTIRFPISNPELSSIEGEKNFPYAFPIVAYLFISITVLSVYRMGRIFRGMA